MKLTCLVCVFKKKFLWQRNAQTDQSYFGSCLMDIRLCQIFCQTFAMDGRCGPHHLSITQTKPRLFYFIQHFSYRISSQWRYFEIAPPRGEQSHWRSKHQIVERHTYHPKQKQSKHKQKTAISLGELVQRPILNVKISLQKYRVRAMVGRFFLTLQAFAVLWMSQCICFLS